MAVLRSVIFRRLSPLTEFQETLVAHVSWWSECHVTWKHGWPMPCVCLWFFYLLFLNYALFVPEYEDTYLCVFMSLWVATFFFFSKLMYNRFADGLSWSTCNTLVYFVHKLDNNDLSQETFFLHSWDFHIPLDRTWTHLGLPSRCRYTLSERRDTNLCEILLFSSGRKMMEYDV